MIYKLAVVFNFLVLGLAIYSGLTDNVGLSIAGIGIYLLGTMNISAFNGGHNGKH